MQTLRDSINTARVILEDMAGLIDTPAQALAPDFVLLREIITAAIAGCLVERGDVGVKVRLDPRLEGVPVVVDSRKLVRVLLNLCGNALKFGNGQDVVVSCMLGDGCQASDTEVTATFTVVDSGRGMTSAELQDCRKLFSRTSKESGGGTGVGLFAVDATLAVLGSKLQLESEVGIGTTATFSLVLTKAPTAP